MEHSLLIIFKIAAIFQLLYYILLSRFLFFEKRPKLNNNPRFPLSVIICAKNEEKNIAEDLPAVLRQNYPDFEVLVINDGSTDNTKSVLEEIAKQYTNLKIIDFPQSLKKGSGKKEALAFGIQNAQYENLVLTDADCKPISDQWLEEMSAGFENNKEIVLGVSPYRKKPGLLNALIRYETFLTAFQYIGFAHWGLPYMGVGRNLAYKKSMFEKNNGLQNHAEITSGDDDLFINEVANGKNTNYIISKESITESDAPINFSSWVKQKKRHYSTGKKYKPLHQVLLSGFIISKFFYWLTLISLTIICHGFNSYYPVIETFLILTIFTYFVNIKFKPFELIILSPVLDLVYILTIIPLGIYGTFSGNPKWK